MKSFEKLNPRSVAVVVDPIQSVRGKVVIDAFRCIPMLTSGSVEVQETTSSIGHLHKSSIQALIRGLDRYYYSMTISYKRDEVIVHYKE